MTIKKYLTICIDYGMSIYDVVCELQELQSHYPELQICQSTELEFRTPDNEEQSDVAED